MVKTTGLKGFQLLAFHVMIEQSMKNECFKGQLVLDGFRLCLILVRSFTGRHAELGRMS